MNENDLVYSDDAKINIYFLYEGINEVNFFVEDHGKAYEYETIFNQLFEGDLKIEKIFDMNGKVSLMEAYNECGDIHPNLKTKNYYLADGDFDRIIKKDEMIDDSCFIYLDCYNIENCYIDKNNIENYAKGLIKQNDDTVRSMVDYDTWKERIVSEATPLFLNYCYIQKYFPEIPTISRSKGEFIDFKSGFQRDDIDLPSYINNIIHPNVTEPDIFHEIKGIYNELYTDGFYFICGKFLMTSISQHIRNISGRTFHNDDFKWFLISHFNSDKLNIVKERVLNNSI